MILIPRKLVPYVLIVLGLIGVFLAVTKGSVSVSDTIFMFVVCALAVIGGTIWAVIDIKKSRNVEE